MTYNVFGGTLNPAQSQSYYSCPINAFPTYSAHPRVTAEMNIS